MKGRENVQLRVSSRLGKNRWSWSESWLDGDLALGRRGRLGHDDGQDAVLQAGADVVLVDARREGEGAVELADGALADPVLVTVVAAGLARLRGVVLALGAALDDKGLLVGELDLNVLLRDAGQLAVQVVGVGWLAHVEARREAADGRGAVAAGRAVQIVVVQQAEERGELAGAEAGEERERHGCSGSLGVSARWLLWWLCFWWLTFGAGSLSQW